MSRRDWRQAQDAEIAATARAVAKHGSITRAAEALGIPRTTAQYRMEIARRKESMKDSKRKDPGASPAASSLNREQAKEINRLRQALAFTKDELAAFTALHVQRKEPVLTWRTPAGKSKQDPLTPILFTSDFHVGEVIRSEDLDGVNEYNQDIFCQRYQTMIDKTISVAKHNTGAAEFPGLFYIRGGDAISGSIHEELAESNDLSEIPACRLLHRTERAGIRRLAEAFGNVRVISIPGNHGRNTHKPRHKGYVMKSYESLLGWWLADSFDGDGKVTFWQPPSGDACFEVSGWRFLAAHGDRMGSRGGMGFVGPAATIARGHQKLYSDYSATGLHVDCILTGHLHTSLKLERGYANGSLAGFSEFARDLRANPAPAQQWLLFVHREHLISHAFELKLSPWPRRMMDGGGPFPERLLRAASLTE